jgi:hypothetical protein
MIEVPASLASTSGMGRQAVAFATGELATSYDLLTI